MFPNLSKLVAAVGAPPSPDTSSLSDIIAGIKFTIIVDHQTANGYNLVQLRVTSSLEEVAQGLPKTLRDSFRETLLRMALELNTGIGGQLLFQAVPFHKDIRFDEYVFDPGQVQEQLDDGFVYLPGENGMDFFDHTNITPADRFASILERYVTEELIIYRATQSLHYSLRNNNSNYDLMSLITKKTTSTDGHYHQKWTLGVVDVRNAQNPRKRGHSWYTPAQDEIEEHRKRIRQADLELHHLAD